MKNVRHPLPILRPPLLLFILADPRAPPLVHNSLPSPALRNPMRRTQALQNAQVNRSVSIDKRNMWGLTGRLYKASRPLGSCNGFASPPRCARQTLESLKTHCTAHLTTFCENRIAGGTAFWYLLPPWYHSRPSSCKNRSNVAANLPFKCGSQLDITHLWLSPCPSLTTIWGSNTVQSNSPNVVL